MIDLKIIIIEVILFGSAVFAFTGNMFLGDYTRLFVAICCVAAGVLLYTTETQRYVPPIETVDSYNLRNQLVASETRTSPQPSQPTPDIKNVLEKIDEKFGELHKAEHQEEVKVEEPPKPLTEIQAAKNKQAEFRKAKKQKDEDPFKSFK
jgi:hypothetical protein